MFIHRSEEEIVGAWHFLASFEEHRSGNIHIFAKVFIFYSFFQWHCGNNSALMFLNGATSSSSLV